MKTQSQDSLCPKSCPECGSPDIEHYLELDYYGCNDCGAIWECDEEDPDCE